MSEARWGGPPPADLVPENAPFDEEQRAWLNGFLAGLLGLGNGEGRAALDPALRHDTAGNATSNSGPDAHAASGPIASGQHPASLIVGTSIAGGPVAGGPVAGSPVAGSPVAGRHLASGLASRGHAAAGNPLSAVHPSGGHATAAAHLPGGALAAAPGRDADVGSEGLGSAPFRNSEADDLDGPFASPASPRFGADSAGGPRSDRAWLHAGAARRAMRGQEAGAPASMASPRPRLVGAGREPGEAHRLRVKAQKKLTLADAGSEIREITLEHEGAELRYQAGDCLSVFPHNDPDLVRALLRAIGARGQEMVSTPNGTTEVWRCLLEDLDITHVRDETLRLFADEAGRSEEAQVLRESIAQATPSSFDLLDLLTMFPSSRPSVERIVATLGALEPRLYAIASSPTHHPGELQLAVRVVRAERGGRERKGVASHFLSDGIFRGDDVFVRVQPGERFILPVERPSPMIMLGSGTGLARYRAFLQELEARGRRGNTWLIMASCFEGDEALYEAELKSWSRIGVLEHLDIVKLGQRGRRVGPEDVLRKRARRVVSWLDRGAFVYACGEGKALSAVLSDTLIDVLGRQGKMSRAEAADVLHVMRREGRYVEEVY
jgi:sulfite reductase (NADPH) flavoprotein alpha-component